MNSDEVSCVPVGERRRINYQSANKAALSITKSVRVLPTRVPDRCDAKVSCFEVLHRDLRSGSRRVQRHRFSWDQTFDFKDEQRMVLKHVESHASKVAGRCTRRNSGGIVFVRLQTPLVRREDSKMKHKGKNHRAHVVGYLQDTLVELFILIV